MARSLLTSMASSFAGGRSVSSTNVDAAASTTFQVPPSWLTKPAQPSANDLFGSLVSQNAPSDLPSALPPPPPPPPQNNAESAPPPANNGPPANDNAPSRPQRDNSAPTASNNNNNNEAQSSSATQTSS